MRVETYIEAHTAAAVKVAQIDSALALMRLYRLPEGMIEPVSLLAVRKMRQVHKFALKYGDDVRLLRGWAEDWGSP